MQCAFCTVGAAPEFTAEGSLLPGASRACGLPSGLFRTLVIERVVLEEECRTRSQAAGIQVLVLPPAVTTPSLIIHLYALNFSALK